MLQPQPLCIEMPNCSESAFRAPGDNFLSLHAQVYDQPPTKKHAYTFEQLRKTIPWSWTPRLFFFRTLDTRITNRANLCFSQGTLEGEGSLASSFDRETHTPLVQHAHSAMPTALSTSCNTPSGPATGNRIPLRPCFLWRELHNRAPTTSPTRATATILKRQELIPTPTDVALTSGPTYKLKISYGA